MLTIHTPCVSIYWILGYPYSHALPAEIMHWKWQHKATGFLLSSNHIHTCMHPCMYICMHMQMHIPTCADAHTHSLPTVHTLIMDTMFSWGPILDSISISATNAFTSSSVASSAIQTHHTVTTAQSTGHTHTQRLSHFQQSKGQLL